MPTSASITMMKMIESLPEPVQEGALEHMQQYIEEIRDELEWGDAFGNSQNNLIAAARLAREEIRQGKAMNGSSGKRDLGVIENLCGTWGHALPLSGGALTVYLRSYNKR